MQFNIDMSSSVGEDSGKLDNMTEALRIIYLKNASAFSNFDFFVPSFFSIFFSKVFVILKIFSDRFIKARSEVDVNGWKPEGPEIGSRVFECIVLLHGMMVSLDDRLNTGWSRKLLV